LSALAINIQLCLRRIWAMSSQQTMYLDRAVNSNGLNGSAIN
jgi:hypothetical protein